MLQKIFFNIFFSFSFLKMQNTYFIYKKSFKKIMLFFTFNVQLQFIKYAEIKIIQKTVYFYYIYFF